MKNIILIKLGGSVITDKATLKKADSEIIDQLSKEISAALKKTQDLLILGHGAGSFAHQSAAKYDTINGIKNKQSLIHASIVKYDASLLNMIISQSLLNAKIPIFPIHPSSIIISENQKVSQVFAMSILNSLKFNFVPLVYGDVVTDSVMGFTIYSTEQILKEIALTLPLYNYKPKMIIEVVKTEGVLDKDEETIPEINNKNINDIMGLLSGSHGTDVTGGMLHKVNEAFALAQNKIPTLIISAESGNLEKAILGKKVKGTWIKT